ncbi:hypothetical protein GOP47_0003404 [Adiantum capillus-veneris]|uniref:Uncharacterized protein n=1 Tax=Adiantum capillus-veneris TaxID=13818 RepID=A0A9D4VDH9_ADICA|nr:hypothetical protein GOP47_0003404 [Adiantum capillus-veneris]
MKPQGAIKFEEALREVLTTRVSSRAETVVDRRGVGTQLRELWKGGGAENERVGLLLLSNSAACTCAIDAWWPKRPAQSHRVIGQNRQLTWHPPRSAKVIYRLASFCSLQAGEREKGMMVPANRVGYWPW